MFNSFIIDLDVYFHACLALVKKKGAAACSDGLRTAKKLYPGELKVSLSFASYLFEPIMFRWRQVSVGVCN